MEGLTRCNFFNKFNKIDILNHKVRKAKIDDQKLYIEALKITPEEAFIKVSNMIKGYKKNKETPFIIVNESGKLVGEIFVFYIPNNEKTIGINIDFFNNYDNVLFSVLLIKKFILYAKYTFKVEKIFFFCDYKNENLKKIYNTFYVEYILDVCIDKFNNKKSLFKFNIYNE